MKRLVTLILITTFGTLLFPGVMYMFFKEGENPPPPIEETLKRTIKEVFEGYFEIWRYEQREEVIKAGPKNEKVSAKGKYGEEKPVAEENFLEVVYSGNVVRSISLTTRLNIEYNVFNVEADIGSDYGINRLKCAWVCLALEIYYPVDGESLVANVPKFSDDLDIEWKAFRNCDDRGFFEENLEEIKDARFEISEEEGKNYRRLKLIVRDEKSKDCDLYVKPFLRRKLNKGECVEKILSVQKPKISLNLKDLINSERGVIDLTLYLMDKSSHSLDVSANIYNLNDGSMKEIFKGSVEVDEGGEKKISKRVPVTSGDHKIVVVASNGLRVNKYEKVFRVNLPPEIDCSVNKENTDVGTFEVECEASDDFGVKEYRVEVWGKGKTGMKRVYDRTSKMGSFILKLPTTFQKYEIRTWAVDIYGLESRRFIEEVSLEFALKPPEMEIRNSIGRSGDMILVDPNDVFLTWKDENPVSVKYTVEILNESSEVVMKWENLRRKYLAIRGLKSDKVYTLRLIASLGGERAESYLVFKTACMLLNFEREIVGFDGEGWKLLDYGGEILFYNSENGRAFELSNVSGSGFIIEPNEWKKLPSGVVDITGEFLFLKNPVTGYFIVRNSRGNQRYLNSELADVAEGNTTIGLALKIGEFIILEKDTLKEVKRINVSNPDRVIWRSGSYFVDDGCRIIEIDERGEIIGVLGEFEDYVANFQVSEDEDTFVIVDESGNVYDLGETDEITKDGYVEELRDIIVKSGWEAIISAPSFVHISRLFDYTLQTLDLYEDVIGGIVVHDKILVITESGVKVIDMNSMELDPKNSVKIGGISEFKVKGGRIFLASYENGRYTVVILKVVGRCSM